MTAIATPHLVIAGAAGIAAFLGAACDLGGGSGHLLDDVEIDLSADTSPDDGVELLTAGGDERIRLPDSPEVGERVPFETTAETRLERNDLSWSTGIRFAGIDVAVEVAGEDPAVETTIEQIDGTPLSDHADPSMLAHVDRNTFDVLFPTEPVGEGAVWTVTGVLDRPPFPAVAIETRFDLIEFDDDRIVVSISQSASFELLVAGVPVTGFLDASGTAVVSRMSPLDVDVDFEQSGVVTTDGIDTVVEFDLSTESS